jgi:predicted phosphodiesterase
MRSPSELIERFAEIIQLYQIGSSTEYDNLKVQNKPSRSTLTKIYGSWANVINEAMSLDCERVDIKVLRKQLDELQRSLQTPTLHLSGEEIIIGVLSDTHLGSRFADLGLLDFAYETFADYGVGTVLHAGDILDGQRIYKGHDFELDKFGADAQVDFCVERYPSIDGITTYFIDGNHDRSFWKDAGNNTGKKISQNRADLVYLGYQEAEIVLGDPENGKKATVRIFHGEDGSAYAISYRPQRYLTELPGKHKPDMLIMGHYHKAETLYYQGVIAVQAGTTQRQTPFMRGRRLSAALGFWIINMTINETGIARVGFEFFPAGS